jgi:hypothetical protein
VIHDLGKECENSCKMEVFHESREKALKAEIAELKDKVLEKRALQRLPILPAARV